ncbi:myosin regulatory light chain A, smooth adductor muscle-like isoform X2 [Haliotis cracherodii]|uniref:myosin regulatory light chain A, smooth adductor muscle-like isoform X2 n=1 Tax=Haliotis rufescens TaxID=6454 RepID=UPI001EAF98F9|nr:myosin regulatory light chain A, smooth adductor muscle-like isoform X2 [Haliotis rufescens]
MAEEAAKKGRGERQASNVFAKMSKKTMQEMKEAFTMIDQNRDGVIDIEDLKDMYGNFGRIPPDAELKEMLAEAPGPLNFTMFLNLFGEKLSGTDPEDTIRNAFAMFDDAGKGKLPEEYVKDLLQNMGDNFTADEIKQTWKESPIEKGLFDYNEFVSKIKGKQDEEEMAAA